MERFRVAVVGGGGTAAAAAWDLSLRGVSVVVLERGELTSGTTGRHHGQLHCGARYALGDPAIARECMAESLALRRLAPDCVEYNQGLFLALDDEGEALACRFVEACRAARIPACEIPVARALRMEGAINPKARRAVLVPDGTIDAYRVPMRFFASARAKGAEIRSFSEVVGIETSGGAVAAVAVRDLRGGGSGGRGEYRLEVDAVVNAAGPWAGRVGALAGVDAAVTPAAGAMVAVEGRVVDMVVSRLRLPGDGDIVVPQRRLSVIGSTQRTVSDPDGLLPTREEVEFLLKEADALVPGFSSRPFRASWAAARPLAGRDPGDGRGISRDFAVVDHGAAGGPRGFYTVLGGKATTLRAMGQAAADAVCARLGVDVPCRTLETPLAEYRDFWRLP